MPRGKKEEHVPAEFAEEAKAMEEAAKTAQSPELTWLTFPNRFAHIRPIEAKDGGTSFERLILTFPPGTQSNGQDISGYEISVGASSRVKAQIFNGEPVTFPFDKNKKINVTFYDREKKEVSEPLPLNPEALKWALINQNKAYQEQRAQQQEQSREAAPKKEAAKDAKEAEVSLDDEIDDMTAAKDRNSDKAAPAPEKAER